MDNKKIKSVKNSKNMKIAMQVILSYLMAFVYSGIFFRDDYNNLSNDNCVETFDSSDLDYLNDSTNKDRVYTFYNSHLNEDWVLSFKKAIDELSPMFENCKPSVYLKNIGYDLSKKDSSYVDLKLSKLNFLLNEYLNVYEEKNNEKAKVIIHKINDSLLNEDEVLKIVFGKNVKKNKYEYPYNLTVVDDNNIECIPIFNDEWMMRAGFTNFDFKCDALSYYSKYVSLEHDNSLNIDCDFNSIYNKPLNMIEALKTKSYIIYGDEHNYSYIISPTQIDYVISVITKNLYRELLYNEPETHDYSDLNFYNSYPNEVEKRDYYYLVDDKKCEMISLLDYRQNSLVCAIEVLKRAKNGDIVDVEFERVLDLIANEFYKYNTTIKPVTSEIENCIYYLFTFILKDAYNDELIDSLNIKKLILK